MRITRISNQEKKRRRVFHFLFLHKTNIMKEIIKQVLGVDVAQKELVVCLGRMNDDWSPDLYARQTFPNNAKGFAKLLDWVKKNTEVSIPVIFVMEATGVYHESFAYFLDEQNLKTCIVLPNKISNYMRTLEINTITDRTASDAICQFGLEENWTFGTSPILRSNK